MTTAEAKAKIFQWLCSYYHDKGQRNDYVDKESVRLANNIPEDLFGNALKEFLEREANIYVEVEISTGSLRLGTGGEQLCQEGTNPFT